MPANKITLEICSFSFESAQLAQASGADRIELCSGAGEGGTTPPISLIEKTVATLTIPVLPIIRPRGGDFFYSSVEFDMMKRDIGLCKELGCAGVTLSILMQDGKIDVKRTQELVNLASPMEVTFIRGFDLTPNPFEAIEALKETGCHRLLTSGQAPRAEQSIELLRELVIRAGNDISIMPGSGINPGNLEQLVRETGAREFHASARKIVPNTNPREAEFGFGNRIECNPESVAALKRIAEGLS